MEPLYSLAVGVNTSPQSSVPFLQPLNVGLTTGKNSSHPHSYLRSVAPTHSGGTVDLKLLHDQAIDESGSV